MILPALILTVFISPVYNTVFQLVREKESHIKETMHMMGMKKCAYWLSWYVHYTIISTAVALISWAILLINVITYSNPLLLLILLLAYA